MKRWIILTGVVVALAAGGTVAVQYMGASTSPLGPGYPVGAKAAARPSGPAARAVVEGDHIHYFGTLPQRTTGKHAWVVRNEGQGELVLWMISSTCSCTLAKFKNGEKAVVPPGESTEIVLEYETRENNGPYEKGAEIGSNDPALPQFALHVRGQVFPAVMTMPTGNVANFVGITNDDDDHKTYVAVYSKDRPDLKILGYKSSRPKDITIDYEPLPPKEAKQILGLERGGYKVTVHARSGLPLGAFREEVVIKTDHPQQPEVRLSVVGKMSGPVNLLPAVLSMHQVDGKTGGTGELIVSVRNNRETKIEIEKAPKKVKTEIAPLDGGTKKGRYRLTVTVPPGTTAQEIEDEVVLKTDHPKAERVSVPVSIWVHSAP